MKDFQSYFTNTNYISAYNANKEGNKKAADKGLVFVEDDTDQFFWEKFINLYYPNQYNVQASIKDRPGERGKRALEQLYDSANEKVLIAIDSDYDFICPNYKYGYHLHQNKYILHTFGFSRESALLEKESLNNFFQSIKFTITHNINILSFVEKFSIIVFKALAIFSNEINNENKNGLIEKDFHRCFNILDQKIVKDDLSLDESLLIRVEHNLHSFFSNLEYTDEKISDSESYLNSFDINLQNAYRFISGHTFYDLIITIHMQLTSVLYRLELEKIKDNYQGIAIQQRKSQLREYFSKQFSIETFCHNYPINENDEIHKKIADKVASII